MKRRGMKRQILERFFLGRGGCEKRNLFDGAKLRTLCYNENKFLS